MHNYRRDRGAVSGVQVFYWFRYVKADERSESNNRGGQNNPVDRDCSKFAIQKLFKSF